MRTLAFLRAMLEESTRLCRSDDPIERMLGESYKRISERAVQIGNSLEARACAQEQEIHEDDLRAAYGDHGQG